MSTAVAAPPALALPHEAGNHARLRVYAAVAALRDRIPGAEERFPFLRDYLAAMGTGGGGPEALPRALRDWERVGGHRLPLVRLAAAGGLGDEALTLWFAVGLPEEDPAFGALYDVMQGMRGESRATVGLLQSLWGPGAREHLAGLIGLGLLEVADAAAPRSAWCLQVAAAPWAAAAGRLAADPAPGLVHRPAHELAAAGDLVGPEHLRAAAARLPALLAAGDADGVVARGPAASGRRTLLGAVARAGGRGVLEVADIGRWVAAGPLATLLGAMPVAVCDAAPGEALVLPAQPGHAGGVGVALGRHGSVGGPGLGRPVMLELGLPSPAERERHWAAGLDGAAGDVGELATRFRMTGGNIRRAAALARAGVVLDGRATVGAGDVRTAVRALTGRLFDGLAARVPVSGGWERLAVDADTRSELELLERRCRLREQLPAALGPAFADRSGGGVRALLTGDSGTGKTLAAGVLASVLGIDLYHLDMAMIVNRYLGETEKNLDRVLSCSEEAGVALLIDEGDALMTQRTAVASSNDRYANIETSFLLQRLDERFEGILLVTTNAPDRIDGAFARRMDAIVEFRPPGPPERRAIWDLHLPPGHGLGDGLLEDLARRCALTGGQIRNAVLHACLLAAGDVARPPGDAHVLAAVRREYRRAGQICPLA